jgi:hypothetical protein
MAKDILLEETQGAGNKTTRDFFRVTAAMFLFALVANLLIQKGEFTKLTNGLFLGLLLLNLAAIFTSTSMVTQIRKDGIYVRYFPFQPSFVHFPWTEIRQVYIRKYDTLTEYNGWGIKIGASGKAYTAGGDTGIQVELSDGTSVLIRTRQPEKVEQVLAAAHV